MNFFIYVYIIFLLISVEYITGIKQNSKLSEGQTTLTYNPTEKRTYNPTEKRAYNSTEERTETRKQIRTKSRRIDETTLEPTEEPTTPGPSPSYTYEPTLIVAKTRSPNVYRTRSPSSEASLDLTPTADRDESEPIVINTEDVPIEEFTRVPTQAISETEPLAIGIVLGAAVVVVGVILFILLGSNSIDKLDMESGSEETTPSSHNESDIIVSENSPLIGQI
jgi:hypothetical protein